MTDAPQDPPAVEEPRPSEVPAAYREAVAELLYHSQIIEALLRVYLSDVYEASDTALHRYGLRFEIPDQYLQKKALGQLVELFSHHTTDDALVKRLRSFIEHRNRAAHTAFVCGEVHGKDPETLAKALEKNRGRIEEVSGLVDEMAKQMAMSHYAVARERELQSIIEDNWDRELQLQREIEDHKDREQELQGVIEDLREPRSRS